MKKLILLILIVCPLFSLAQDTTKHQNQLEIIADELNISEQQAYDSLVREQQVQAYRNLMIFVTMLLALYTLKKTLKIDTNKVVESDRFQENYSKYIALLASVRSGLKAGYDHWDANRAFSEIDSPISGIAVDVNKNMGVKKVIFIILSLIVFAASIIYNSVMLSETFTGLFNPEYGALEQLQFLN